MKFVHHFCMLNFHSLQEMEDSQEYTKNIIKKTEDGLKRDEMALKNMMEKLEKAKKSFEYRKEYLETQKNDFESQKGILNKCCRVCGEFYNDTERRKSFLTKCGHVACLKCFKDEFTDDIDYPYCPWHITAKDCETEYYQHDVKPLFE